MRDESSRARFFGELRGRIIRYILAAVPWAIAPLRDRLEALFFETRGDGKIYMADQDLMDTVPEARSAPGMHADIEVIQAKIEEESGFVSRLQDEVARVIVGQRYIGRSAFRETGPTVAGGHGTAARPTVRP